MLRGRSLRVTGVPVLALTIFSACYRYIPASSGDLIPGSEYRGHLTTDGSQRVAPLVGENVERFDGRIITVLDTAYLVAMSATLKRSDPRQTVWTGEQLMIPRAAVSRFELRQLDRPRTLRAVGLFALGVGVVGALVFSIQGDATIDGTPPPPPPPP